MPGFNNTANLLAPFPPAVTKMDIQNADAISDPSSIIGNLLSLSEYLVDIVNHTTIFGPGVKDPYKPSLATLYHRLTTGIPSLTPLSAIAKNAQRIKETIGIRIDATIKVSERPFQDFEDIYYAVLARMQEMLHSLNMRIASGFNSPSDTLFPDGPCIADWRASLTVYWVTLNDATCARALDDAVRAGRVAHLYEEVMAKLGADEISREVAGGFLEELFHGQSETEGMVFVEAWDPLRVGIELEQKYRVLFAVEKEEDERRARMEGMRKKMVKKKKKEKKAKAKDVKEKKTMKGGKENGEMVLKSAWGGCAGGGETGEQTDENLHNERGQDEPGDEQDGMHQDQPRRGYVWQTKHQLVSDYSKYLRVQAGYTAQSGYNGSLDGGTLVNSPAADMVDQDEDLMEF